MTLMYTQPTRTVNNDAALTVRMILAAAKADEIPETHLEGASLALLRAADALEASDERAWEDGVSDELDCTRK
jgi:hypothetical protein